MSSAQKATTGSTVQSTLICRLTDAIKQNKNAASMRNEMKWITSDHKLEILDVKSSKMVLLASFSTLFKKAVRYTI